MGDITAAVAAVDDEGFGLHAVPNMLAGTAAIERKWGTSGHLSDLMDFTESKLCREIRVGCKVHVKRRSSPGISCLTVVTLLKNRRSLWYLYIRISVVSLAWRWFRAGMSHSRLLRIRRQHRAEWYTSILRRKRGAIHSIISAGLYYPAPNAERAVVLWKLADKI